MDIFSFWLLACLSFAKPRLGMVPPYTKVGNLTLTNTYQVASSSQRAKLSTTRKIRTLDVILLYLIFSVVVLFVSLLAIQHVFDLDLDCLRCIQSRLM